MILILDQLIYTSFPKVGFKSLASAEVPAQIQQAFVERIVYQHWDSYNPPDPGYQAVYLEQIAPQDSLFGWLYNDGTDELGRAYPYFLCYYLSGSLNLTQLQNILTCLQRGPIALVDRDNPPNTLATIALSDPCQYKPARKGVPIATNLLKQSQITLENQELINLFAAADRSEIVCDREYRISIDIQQQPSSPIQVDYSPIPSKVGKQETEDRGEEKEGLNRDLAPKSLLVDSKLSHASSQISRSRSISKIVRELITKSHGIQGAALVSATGKLMATPMGMTEEQALTIAHKMLSLIGNTTQEFNGEKIQVISVQSREDYLIITPCYQEFFLLVKTEGTPTALLKKEIQQAVKALHAELKETVISSTKQISKGNASSIIHLLVIGDPRGKKIVSLTDKTYSIGRSPSNNIVINSLSVSRQHAILLRINSPETNQECFRLIDGSLKGKRSSNGLFINGVQCLYHDLKHGDIIQFGPQVKAKYYTLLPQRKNRIPVDC